MKTETAELITFGNLVRIPADEITPARAIQAADYACSQILKLESGNAGREWPSIKARIEREKAALNEFVARFDPLIADSEFAKNAKALDDDDDMRKF